MGLTMSERKAVTKKLALDYRRGDRARKGQILDQVCELNGWHRSHARKALTQALVLKVVRPRPPRPPLYGEAVIKALRFLWAVQGTPCGRLLAAALPDLVPRLRRLGELNVDDETATLLLQIAPATIDRRLSADWAKLTLRGRSHTKPGTLLKDSIPMRTWAEWDDAVPGFVEIDLVGHEGGNSKGEFCFTLDITDIATGWTETRSVRNKAQKWVFAAIKDATASFPFPILGIDSDYADLGRVCFSNGVSGGFHLVGLRGRPAVGEGDGECVERGLPPHRPSGAAATGGVEATGDKIQALQRGLLGREMTPGPHRASVPGVE